MKARTVIQNDPCAEILISYASDESIEVGKKDLLKPLLDIDHLGTELNIPISHKIIEGHNGELDVKSEEGINAFVIKLPIVDRRSSKVSVKGGHISEQ
jgi:hypothetical protein